MIRERLKYSDTGITLTFGLSNKNKFTGIQQEIDAITEETKDELINPIIDNEIRRFIHNDNNGAVNLNFYFTAIENSYNNSFLLDGAGFTLDEIEKRNDVVLNSFFILDFYDSFDSNTQTKIFTSYLTKISTTPTYKIYSDTINQYYKWEIPKSFLDEQTGNTVTAYVKFSFYNAKYGFVSLFYNKDNDSLLTPEKMYFKLQLDLTNKTWEFINNPLIGYEMPRNTLYTNKVNNSFNNFENNKQVYPTGNTFQSDGTYTEE